MEEKLNFKGMFGVSGCSEGKISYLSITFETALSKAFESSVEGSSA